MMRVMIVDDERLALVNLRKQLEKVGGTIIVHELLDAESAIQALSMQDLDVVFLDIQMPGRDGIALAEVIQSIQPSIHIVFVTGHNEFAIKAFELNALDYLLKPVGLERLKLTVERTRQQISPRERIDKGSVKLPEELKLCCFQRMEVEYSGGKREPFRWRTNKAQELFAFLLHRRGELIRKDVLLELLWPEVDYKRGFTQLYTAIYQIRKTLSSIGIKCIVASNEKGYKLEIENVHLDTELWERGVGEAPPISAETIDHHLKLAEMYSGDYLVDYDFVWAENERQRIRYVWYKHVKEIADWLTNANRLSEAIDLYGRIADRFPHAEQIYFALMKLYLKLGDTALVEQKYEQLRKIMADELGLQPKVEIQEWYSGLTSLNESEIRR
ncbi:Protein-glutamate methylesterase/protein-glutamine glutaminase [Paenibacillus plantiphilus]|uniref:Protein-glutamate methylesterase/protein-glutamine glutaminase n=1 Tax=Paenibacillus plantiphilus TaxID=2905650 RepID=A0ABN8G8L7_9BACL|nr:response regulator [Paenibacillus plantiphilus]CAH1197688.1 Protein-glutamate methylesterase/protein-glutamine glutaminase [Paenibacillus plantiphilus]